MIGRHGQIVGPYGQITPLSRWPLDPGSRIARAEIELGFCDAMAKNGLCDSYLIQLAIVAQEHLVEARKCV